MSFGVRSIQWKVLGLIFGLVAAVTCLFVVVLPWMEFRAARRAHDELALSYAQLSSAGLESAIAFDDAGTAREVLDPLAERSDVLGVSLLREDGTALYSTPSPAVPAHWPADRANDVLTHGETDLVVTAPVVAREGKIGFVVVWVSTQQLRDARQKIVKTNLVAMAVALLAGLVGARLIAGSLTRRLRKLTRSATQVANGDLAAGALDDRSGDEVGELAHAFDRMVVQLRDIVDVRESAAREQERASAALARNRDLRLVLDNVTDGLLIVEADGRICGERSAAIDAWFGPLHLEADGTPPRFWSLVAAHDRAVADWFELSWAMMQDGFMPIEASLDQLPRSLVRGDSTYRLALAPIADTTRFLVRIVDVTEEIRLAALEAEERTMGVAVGHLLVDKDSFVAFVLEARAILAMTMSVDATSDELRRGLHTLKGNLSMLRFDELAELCHALETDLSSGASIQSSDHRRLLGLRWSKVDALIGSLRADSGQTIEIERAELEAIERAIQAGQRAASVEMLRALAFEPADRRLGRVADQTRTLASRIGCDNVDVVTQPSVLKLDGQGLAPFWATLTHAARNALSHGIEPRVERVAAGKPDRGTVTLEVTVEGAELVVRVADDGRGIDWEGVRRAARERGLTADTHRDLVAALFAPRLTTRASADQMSGRGEGLGALLAAVETLGGSIEVESVRGQGTAFRFRLPSKYAFPTSRLPSRERAHDGHFQAASSQ